MSQSNFEPLEVDWDFPSPENREVNSIINEVRLADHEGTKLDTAQVRNLVYQLVSITGRYDVIADPPETALIYYLTGKGNTSNRGSHVAPFCTPETIRGFIRYETEQIENQMYRS